MIASALKQKVLVALEELPATATLEDLIERLIFLAKIEEGLADSEAGRVIPHSEIEAEFLKK